MKISKSTTIFLLILTAFIAIRAFGLELPYHQDESKYVESFGIYRHSLPPSTPHPPLTQLFFAVAADMFGYDDIRMMPFAFSVANLILLFIFVRMKFGDCAALWSAGFFAVCSYSVLASLMVDTDGALLPFFLLLSLVAFARWERASTHRLKIGWGIGVLAALILGMMTKLSFAIVIAAYAIELCIRYGSSIRRWWRWLASGLVLGCVGLGLLWIFGIPASYDASRTLSHVFDHVRFSGRNYLQVGIQFAKAFFYLSPAVLIALFIRPMRRRDAMLFFVLLGVGTVFYGILFDFSSAALDKYLQYMIVPFAILIGVSMADEYAFGAYSRTVIMRSMAASAIAVSLLLGLAWFLPHDVPPLYPKEAWVDRITSLRWDFLFPFTGGSGPLGFYMSWLFIGASWVMGVAAAASAVFFRNAKGAVLIFLVVIGLGSNLFFAEEYIIGRAYGNPNTLAQKAIIYLKDSDIPTVITYNDIGGSLLRRIDKYQRRLYAAPKFEQEYVATLNEFKGHYLVIDIPHLNPESLYGRYFRACDIAYREHSSYISSTIYDCRDAIVPPMQ